MVPEALADGSRPGPVPQRVAAAVVEPVIGERRLRARPGSAEGCLTPWWDGELEAAPSWSPDRPALRRFRRLAEGLGPPTVWIGTDGLSALRLGAARAAPGWPDLLLAGCTARWSDGRWRPQSTTWRSPSGGLVLKVRADADGVTVTARTTAPLPLLD